MIKLGIMYIQIQLISDVFFYYGHIKHYKRTYVSNIMKLKILDLV